MLLKYNMKKLNFKTYKEFVGSVLKNPKILVTAGLISIAGVQTIKAQQLMQFTSISPVIDPAGSSIHSKTLALNLGDKANKFLLHTLEYRSGRNFNIKNFAEGTYNFGIEVGTNNLMFNNKLVSDKLYEQVNLAMKLSSILNKNITFKIGFNKKLNNYVLKNFNIGDATRGLNLESSVLTKKTGTGINLYFKKGKLVSYDGVQEINFSKKFSGAIRLKNKVNQNLKKAYYELRGTVDMSSKKYVFVPSFGYGANADKLRKPNYELGVLFKPKKVGNKFSAYGQIGFNRDGKWLAATKINYQLTKGKKPKIIPRERSKLRSRRARKGRK